MTENIIYNNTQDFLLEGVNILANTVKTTLGPRGNNVLIFNKYNKGYLTKDGVTVAKNIKHPDPTINNIIETVRESSINTAKTVGDGTTTTLVLLQDIFQEGINCLKEKQDANLLKEGMQLALKDIIELIDNQSESITNNKERLKQIASISANNDSSIGDIVFDAISRSKNNGEINICNSNNYNTYITEYNGFTIDSGYFSPHFLPTGYNSVEYNNALIYISDVELSKDTVFTILKKAKNKNAPIIIIAPDFNELIGNILIQNHLNSVVNICPIKAPGFASNRKFILDDLCTYVNTTINSTDLGDCDKIVIHRGKTSIIVNKQALECTNRIKELETLITDSSLEEVDKDNINKRLTALTGNVININVGATTELELNEKKDRIEDAVCAVKAALEEGISEGGGKTFIKVYNKLNRDISALDSNTVSGYNIVKQSLIAPFFQLCANAGIDFRSHLNIVKHSTTGIDFKTLKPAELKNVGIIDATKVLKTAISNAVDIASNLLTTKVVLDNTNV